MGRCDKYGELKRRCILRKAKQSKASLDIKKWSNDIDFNIRRSFYYENKNKNK